MGVGIGTLTDSLSAIKHHIFEEKSIAMTELLQTLNSNFKDHEKIRLMLWNKTPKYGNDDDRADSLLKASFDTFYEMINGRRNTRGGCYRVNYLSTTCHVYFGSVVGATPDGRRSEEPLSEGVSPVQGADEHGPTAVIKSVAKMDQVKVGGLFLTRSSLQCFWRGRRESMIWLT